MPRRSLVTHLVGFARLLRDHNVPVVLSDEIDGAKALSLIDLFDPAEVRSALRTALKIRPQDRSVFDRLFREWWTADQEPLARGLSQRDARHGAGPPPVRPSRDSTLAPTARSGDGGSGEDSSSIGYSPDVLLRRKPFDECSQQDLEAMEPALARLVQKLATKRSRRLVPTAAHGLVDLRRSFRRSIATSGELFSLAMRQRPIEEPRLVLILDTSGSMDTHSRFLLAFALSMRKVTRRLEVLVFNTSLTRITPWLSTGSIRATLQSVASAVPDWSGGTRIGACLTEFVERHMTSSVDAKTSVIILSDGLDRGEPDLLSRAMRAIHAAARTTIWLNPLAGDVRYQPIARGMAAALPFIDHFASAHNLESLEQVIPILAA